MDLLLLMHNTLKSVLLANGVAWTNAQLEQANNNWWTLVMHAWDTIVLTCMYLLYIFDCIRFD